MDFTASLESSSSLQVIFVNPAKPKTKRHFSIPQSEEQWQNCRCEYGLATVDSLINKVSNLRGWDQRHLQEWEKFVVIAATVVDLYRGQEEDTLRLGKVYAGRTGYETRRKDRAAVLSLISLLDRLYSAGLKHRAFELLILLNLRLSKLRLWTLRYFKEIFLEFPKILFEPKQEIQACVPLYLPFLVQLLRPEYTLNTIQRALKSKTLTRQDLDAFQQACHTRQSVPSLRFDSGGFQASQLPQESQALDHELGQALHIDKMFPADLNIAIAGYKVFDMSQELYQKASVAEKHQEICNRIERSNACITQYEWSDRFHLPAANQAIDDLVYNGVLRGSDVFRQKTYLKYCGHLKVENSSLQILIPTSPREILDVSLLSSEHNIDHKIPWRTDQVLLLGQGTILSTKGNIGFISIAMPLSSE
ncbi:hypothetical protein FPOAC2_13120 [Fusarium poae]